MLAASSKSLSPQVHKLITINNDNLQRLEDKVARLKAQLAAERRRHVRLENALSKYFAIVEQEIREKTNRVDILRKALLPELKVGPKQ
jgi:predicted  nucleic acid-binding Zn-ribbon protein